MSMEINGTSGVTFPDASTQASAGITASSSNTLSNKTISLGSNTVSGTIAQFNTACTDADFATIAGSETLTSKTLTNPSINNYTEGVVAIGTVTSSHTFSLTNGTLQTATLTASTACTFTMPTATAGKSFIVLLKQAASTGNGTATFTGVKWSGGTSPTITATAGKMDILSFVSDGTNWYGNAVQNYTP